MNFSGLELITAILTGAAAVTLIPHSRNPIRSAVELLVWIGFVLSSGLCIATFGNPKIQEATAAVAWGAIGLAQVQASFVLGIVGAWTGAHRFAIANWIALAAGADALTLAFIASLRSARQSAPRIHLAEWFELPNFAFRPAYVPVPDPLAAIDRRLAAAARTEVESVRRRLETSPTVARAAAGTAHVLRPGHLRLLMVKLALNNRWRREALAHSSWPANVGPIDAGPAVDGRGSASKRSRRHPGSRPAAQSAMRSSNKKEGGRRDVAGFRHRVAS